MIRYRLTVALLLVSGLINGAAAGDELSKTKASKKAKAIDAYLEKVGLNSPDIRRFAHGIHARMEGKSLRLMEQHYEKQGRLLLVVQTDADRRYERLQIKFKPYDSNMEYIATPGSVMMHYRFNF